MRVSLKNSLILILILSILISSFSTSVLSYEQYNSTDIDKLAFKQELAIPIDTSLEIAKFQPIDIK